MNAKRSVKAKTKRQAEKGYNTKSNARKTRAPSRASNSNLYHDEKTNRARAVGVKSALYYNGKTLLSGYDNKTITNTVIEKEIIDSTVNDFYSPGCYDASVDGQKIQVANTYYKETTAKIDNPACKPIPGIDLIRAKDLLERRFFGKTYSDNVHIQIAYNILDIEKILAQYINTIIFALNNIALPNSNQDFVGNLHANVSYSDFSSLKNYEKKYSVFKEKYAHNHRLLYFDSAFCDRPGNLCSEENIYYILTILSEWRQFVLHTEETKKLYSPESWMNKVQKNIVRQKYEKGIDDFNRYLYERNKKVIAILMRELHVSSSREIDDFAKRFYDFAARRKHKHIGISIPKLRDQILKSTDDNRYKTCMDFAIYNYYLDHPCEKEAVVRALRNVSCNKGEKEKIYNSEAKRLCPELSFLNQVKMEGYQTNSQKMVEKTVQQALREFQISSNQNLFPQSLYFLSLLLTAKDASLMINSLRYKFESISGFIKVLSQQGEHTRFCREYELFERSSCILDWLDDILSVRPRGKIEPGNFPPLYSDVFLSLSNKTSHRYDLSNTVRNFLLKNIVNSWNYSYLMHYANPNIVYHINHTPMFVKFVLNGIRKSVPEKTDEFYNLFCGEEVCRDINVKIDRIAEKIAAFRLEDILSELMEISKSSQESKQDQRREKNLIARKESLKAKISLYYTIPYLFIKNLINVNSRYFMALYALERDDHLFFPFGEIKDNYCRLADESVRYRKEKNSRRYELRQQIDNLAIRIFRNQVAHINILQLLNDHAFTLNIKDFSTYFELYHYLIQLQIKKLYKNTSQNTACAATVKTLTAATGKYHTYSRDFLKMLCYPFSYNLPRYRNLSENSLFYVKNTMKKDRNHYLVAGEHSNPE